jgi:hypothetical protein
MINKCIMIKKYVGLAGGHQTQMSGTRTDHYIFSLTFIIFPCMSSPLFFFRALNIFSCIFLVEKVTS